MHLWAPQQNLWLKSFHCVFSIPGWCLCLMCPEHLGLVRNFFLFLLLLTLWFPPFMLSGASCISPGWKVSRKCLLGLSYFWNEGQVPARLNLQQSKWQHPSCTKYFQTTNVHCLLYPCKRDGPGFCENKSKRQIEIFTHEKLFLLRKDRW